jgi:hypothetical protein
MKSKAAPFSDLLGCSKARPQRLLPWLLPLTV